MLCIQVWFKSPPVFQLTDQTKWLLITSLTLITTATSTKVLSVLLKVAQHVPKCLYETEMWMKDVGFEIQHLHQRRADFIAHMVNCCNILVCLMYF